MLSLKSLRASLPWQCCGCTENSPQPLSHFTVGIFRKLCFEQWGLRSNARRAYLEIRCRNRDQLVLENQLVSQQCVQTSVREPIAATNARSQQAGIAIAIFVFSRSPFSSTRRLVHVSTASPTVLHPFRHLCCPESLFLTLAGTAASEAE